jgi:LPS sulfotransferase NodH
MVHFILLAHPRSGSTLLVRSLGEHPNVRMFGELFNDEEEERERAFSQISRCAVARRRGIDASMYYREGEDGGRFVHEKVFYKRYSEEVTKSVGFKIFYEQARENSEAKKVWEYLLANRDVRVIHLRRRNLLETYLSLRVASLTNEWTQPKGREPAARPELFPSGLEPEACASYFDRIAAYRLWVERCWKERALLTLDYETDLCSNYDETLRRIEDFLEVDHQPAEQKLEKQARCHPRERIGNYDELKEYFRYTPHQEYFE